MRHDARIGVVIPAFNEAGAIALVIREIPNWVDQIVVADNASTDGTGDIAKAAGARVVREDEPGYGAACLAGISALDECDVVVFVDGDHSDYPEDMAALVDPIVQGDRDLMIASRALGNVERGALTLPQRFGNWLATRLIEVIWRAHYTDLGPFRAIRFAALQELGMRDRNFGWTVEMQIRAAEKALVHGEVPARYRRRIGRSKVSGTVKGTLMAGYKILLIIAVHAARRGRRHDRRKPVKPADRSAIG
ncbi:MAG: glycosyltransferase family 2 protein [Hyphomicrobiaceae bacterium]